MNYIQYLPCKAAGLNESDNLLFFHDTPVSTCCLDCFFSSNYIISDMGVYTELSVQFIYHIKHCYRVRVRAGCLQVTQCCL